MLAVATRSIRRQRHLHRWTPTCYHRQSTPPNAPATDVWVKTSGEKKQETTTRLSNKYRIKRKSKPFTRSKRVPNKENQQNKNTIDNQTSKCQSTQLHPFLADLYFILYIYINISYKTTHCTVKFIFPTFVEWLKKHHQL